MAIQFLNNPKVGDNVKIEIGASSDLQIYHDATNSYIDNQTGNLFIVNKANDKDIRFQTDNGAGGTTTYFTIDGLNGINQFSKNVSLPDNVIAKFGNSSDLQIYHSGVTSFIKDTGTGNLEIWADGAVIIKTGDGTETKALFDTNGSVDLYYDNSKKFETTSAGISVTGTITASGSTAAGVLILKSTAASDLTISTSAANTWEFNNSGNNSVYNGYSHTFKNGSTTGLTINNSGNSTFGGDVSLADNKKIKLGAGVDLELYSNGTDGYVVAPVDDLVLQAADDVFIYTQGGEDAIIAKGNAAVELYHNNVKKFETTANGVNIVDSELGIGAGHATASPGNAVIFAPYGAGTNIAGGQIQIYSGRSTGNAAGGSIKFYISPVGSSGSSSNAHAQVLLLDSGKNATFAGNVNIGATTGTSVPLLVKSTGNNTDVITVEHTGNAVDLVNLGQYNNHGGLLIKNNSGTNKVFFNSAGDNSYILDSNVGIGTTSPAAKLTVQSDGADFMVRSADYTISRIIPRGTGANLDKGLFSLMATNVENVRIDSAGNSWFNGGNVGIGTTTPASKLTIDGLSNYDGIEVKGTGASRPSIQWSNATQGDLGSIFGTEGNALVLTSGSSNATTLTLDSSNNATFAGGITVAGDDAQFNHNIVLEGSVFHKDDTNTSFGFPADDAIAFTTSGSERMRILNGGNVGIGTSAPDVSGAGTSSTVLSVIETVGNRRGILELGDNQNADTGGIGSINFVGTYQNAGHKVMAEIRASGSGATSGQRGSFISMFTKANGTAAISERMRIKSTGQIQFNAYGLENFTGTATYQLAVDSSGNIIEIGASDLPGGPYLPLSGGTLTGSLTVKAKGSQLGSSGYYINSQFSDVIGGANVGVIIAHNDTSNGAGAIAGINSLAFLTYGTDWTQALLLDGSQNATFAGDVIFNGNGVISSNTADGSDNAQLSLAGGGADSDGRGARLRLYGNEHASLAGAVDLSTGNIAGSDMYLGAKDTMQFSTSGSERMRIKSTGQIQFDAYGLENITGTAAYLLAVEADGDVIEVGASDIPGGPYLPLSGGTLTGDLTISNATPSLTLTDTDNSTNIVLKSVGGGLVVNSASDQAYEIASSEKMRLTSTGRLGIGTTAPVAKFEVTDGSSSITLQEFSNGAAIFLDGVNGDFIGGDYYHILADGSSYLGLGGYGGGATPLNIDSSGNVGIGTTTPSSKLSLSGSQSALDLTRGTAGDSKWELSSDSTKLYIAEMSTGTRDYVMTIKETSGNVGIGTTDPGATLQIGGGTANVLQKIHGSGTAGLQIFTGGGAGTKIAALEQYFSNEGSLQLFLSGTGKVRLRANGDSFLNGGNVGIGLTAPTAKLHVSGNTKLTNGTFAVSSDANVGGSGGFSYSFRDAVGINNPNSLSAPSVAGYVMSVGRSTSSGVGGGVYVEGESNFVRGIGLGTTGKYTSSHSLNIDGTGLAIKNNTSGSNNNWSVIKNTATGSAANLAFVTGQGTALTLNNDKSSTFAGAVTFDNVISAIRASFVSTLTNATVLSAEGNYTANGSVKLFEAKRNGGAVKSDWDYHDSSPIRMSIGTSTSHNFAIKTADTPRLTIDTSGNVGIGNTPNSYADQKSLTINGTDNSRLDLQVGGSNKGEVSTSAGALFLIHNTGDVRFQPGGAFQMIVKSGGNVGINTTSPSAKLHVADSFGGGAIKVAGLITDSAAHYYGFMHDATDLQGTTQVNTFYSGGAIKASTTITDYAGIRIDTPNVSADAAVVTNNYGIYQSSSLQKNYFAGKIGIGTISPGAKLDVVVSDVNVTPNGNSSAVFRQNANNYITILSGTNNEGGLLFGNSSDAADGWIAYQNGSGNQFIGFGTANSEKMRITSAGNVGIGTSAPAYKLEISGGAISIKGNAPGNSLRFNSIVGTTATSRNALYVDTSNVFQIGNANYTSNNIVGPTKTANLHVDGTLRVDALSGNAPSTDGYQEPSETIIGGSGSASGMLGDPGAWLDINVDGSSYYIPLYSAG